VAITYLLECTSEAEFLLTRGVRWVFALVTTMGADGRARIKKGAQVAVKETSASSTELLGASIAIPRTLHGTEKEARMEGEQEESGFTTARGNTRAKVREKTGENLSVNFST